MPTGGLRRELASTLSDLESLDGGAALVVRVWEERGEIQAVSADGQEGSEQQQSPAGCTLCLRYPQGSSKLEKAEVLQMTVDHLKMLHASGGTGTILLTRHVL